MAMIFNAPLGGILYMFLGNVEKLAATNTKAQRKKRSLCVCVLAMQREASQAFVLRQSLFASLPLSLFVPLLPDPGAFQRGRLIGLQMIAALLDLLPSQPNLFAVATP